LLLLLLLLLQGSARVIRCLQDHRSSLSQTCAAALFDHEVRTRASSWWFCSRSAAYGSQANCRH
jgi:hypothetical protein